MTIDVIFRGTVKAYIDKRLLRKINILNELNNKVVRLIFGGKKKEEKFYIYDKRPVTVWSGVKYLQGEEFNPDLSGVCNLDLRKKEDMPVYAVLFQTMEQEIKGWFLLVKGIVYTEKKEDEIWRKVIGKKDNLFTVLLTSSSVVVVDEKRIDISKGVWF